MLNDLSSSRVSCDHYYTLLLQQPKFLLLQHEELHKTMTSQADRMNNVSQDNRVKLRVVTFVYVYLINMQKTTANCF